MKHEEGHTKSAVSLREEEILNYWKKNNIFERSVAMPAGQKPKGEFVFLDGPPFANGLPHYGHVIGTVLKDVFPRYKSMNGFRVPRIWGWDCHGLPVENLIEKELGLKVKKDIEEFGVQKFNEAARESVLRFAEEWRRIIPRIGRWVDMENDYKTMDPSYTESVWWGFKGLFDKGLVSEGYKAMHLCPRCETTLSNFEVNQGYKDIADISVYVKFELADAPGTFIVAWTTTAWSLPGNVALAVGEDVLYVKVLHEGAYYILAKERVADVFSDGAEVVEEMLGKALEGLKYKPLFDYYSSGELENKERGWTVQIGSFVTTEDGTGVVHIAPAFGEDDMSIGREKKLPFVQHVHTNGRFKDEVTDFAGLMVKPKEDHQSTDVEIIKNLAHRGLLLAKKKITHSYPHCWRCDTPLLNYASRSWFVKVPAIKEEIIKNNNLTNWVPAHMREGRFGKWLEGAREWAVSRSRFWGAPIPVWRCEDCHTLRVAGSFAEIQKPAKNRYVVMRHGQGENNVKEVVSCVPENPHHLTEQGKAEAIKAGESLQAKKIDLLFSSDFVRTKETAEIVAKEIGIDVSEIQFDARLREVNFGAFNNKPLSEYRAEFPTLRSRFASAPENGETLGALKKRVAEFLYECEEKYEGKTILIISHEYPVWMLSAVAEGVDERGAEKMRGLQEDFIATAEVRDLSFAQFPHNANFELDVHRPYIDEVTLSCVCGGVMRRVPEVFDCWFESGSMPFAEVHHPFEGDAGKRIPADFIAEGPDQTRGWFYTLMVLSTALFGRPAFKNVVVNGLVQAEDGQKMSKRLRNYPEIEHVLGKYGADALRLYLMGSPVVRAEDLNFSERGVEEVLKKTIQRLENSLALYDLGKGEDEVLGNASSDHVLDRWIIARLNELISEMTAGLEAYEVDSAVRPIAEFVDDFSAWYLRRSRDRFKGDDVVDRMRALSTTRYVIEEFSKVLAPVAPFLAEYLYQYVTTKGGAWKGSVHLLAWPKPELIDEYLIAEMARARKVVEQALALRQKAGIKVRQPLAHLSTTADISRELQQVVAEEVNVKRVSAGSSTEIEVTLDTVLTEELRNEGEVRELMRAIQEKRKEAGLLPKDSIALVVSVPEKLREVFVQAQAEILKTVGATEVSFSSGEELSIEIRKV